MKRKHEEIDKYIGQKRRVPTTFIVSSRPVKVPKKNPMIRLFALVKGYLVRKLNRYRIYPFYQ
jgi:hypothetical protein